MHRKTGFTMVEIILILVVISTALIGIITGVTKTTRYVSEMRQRTLAMNLAKEGIEIMYQIRDTNWERWSANKDQCWLKADPMFDDGDGCENDPWIRKGDWSIEREEINGQTYHRLHSVDANADSLHTALGK